MLDPGENRLAECNPGPVARQPRTGEPEGGWRGFSRLTGGATRDDKLSTASLVSPQGRAKDPSDPASTAKLVRPYLTVRIAGLFTLGWGLYAVATYLAFMPALAPGDVLVGAVLKATRAAIGLGISLVSYPALRRLADRHGFAFALILVPIVQFLGSVWLWVYVSMTSALRPPYLDAPGTDLFLRTALEYGLTILTIAAVVELVSRSRHAAAAQTDPAVLAMDDSLLLRENGRRFLFSVADVTHVKAEDNYTLVHTTRTPPVLVKRSLSDWERRLPPRHFFRVHRSHLVNLRHVEALQGTIGRTTIQVLGAAEPVPLSRRYAARLEDQLSVDG